MNAFVEAINELAGQWWVYVLHATWTSTLLAVILLGVVHLGRSRTNGTLDISDHVSRNPRGNERAIITPASVGVAIVDVCALG